MSYKIIRITNLYPEYLSQYKRTYTESNNKSYADLYGDLTSDSFDTASSMAKNFRKIGVEASNLYTNVSWLQNQWKIENGCLLSDKELLIEQLKVASPDVIWIDNPTLIDSDWINCVRESVKSLRLITGLVCAPYSSRDVKIFKLYDLIFTCTPCLNQELNELGMKSHLLYHGFDSDVLEIINKNNDFPEVNCLFAGSLYAGGGYHKTRIEYLQELLASNVNVKIYGSIDNDMKVLTKLSTYYLINLIRSIGANRVIKNIPLLNRYETYGDTPVKFYSRQLKASVHPGVYGLEQFKLLSRAKLCFNMHGEIAKNCAGNQRLFEATGLGSCLVTDWKENISDLFEPEKEVITYKSLDECITKIKWLLNNPSEAEKIGKAGQVRTLRDHTIENRVNRINELLINELK